MLPSATDLTYFQEISKLLNLSRAAEKLGISQPSLSLSIKRLEENLGAELLIREKRGVKLTRAGKKLQVGSRKLLADWEVLSNEAISLKNDVVGTYRLGLHPSVALYTLHFFIPQLLTKYPYLNIDLIHDHSKAISHAIVNHEVDIGLVINPINHPDLIISPLIKDEVCLWKHKGLEVTNSTPLIADPSLAQTQDLLKKIKKHNLSTNSLLTSGNLEVIASLTQAKAGIGILPSRVVNNIKNHQLVKVDKTPIFKDELAIVYHLQSKSLSAIQRIKEEIIEKIPR